jgi:hypothetical protein
MEQIAGAIKTQVDEHAGVAMFDVSSATEGGEEDCRVILSVSRSTRYRKSMVLV